MKIIHQAQKQNNPLVENKSGKDKLISLNHALTFILFTKFIASSNSTGFLGAGCSSSDGSVISYPLGKKVLNPNIRSLWPLNSSFTLAMTPAVSILRYTQRKHNSISTHKNQDPLSQYNTKIMNK